MNNECTKIEAVKLARIGIIRGIIPCPKCEFGHSPYDVIRQPEKYKDLLELIK